MNNAKLIGPNFVTVMINGTTHTINSDHANYKQIREALKKNDYKAAEKFINVAKTIETFVAGKVKVVNGKVMFGNEEVKGAVVDRILQMLREGFSAEPMVNFLNNLMKNPSKRAVDELYLFLEASNLPITEDGCFLAYKKVNTDYKDFYTGKMDNSVGTVVEMERNKVDDNKDRTCSHGLHFCSLDYLPHYHGGEGVVMIVKINPADVVSIPSDYNNAKGRTAKYEVIGQHTKGETTHAFTAPVYTKSCTPVMPTVGVKKSPNGNPSLVGYNAGRSDASRNRPYDSSTGFAGDDAARYVNAYRKGWASVGTVPSNTSADVDSDLELWSDDWYDVGYEDGKADAMANEPYDSNPPSSCDDQDSREVYSDGYSDGWYEVKKS